MKQVPLDTLCSLCEEFGALRGFAQVQMGTPEAVESLPETQRAQMRAVFGKGIEVPFIRSYLPSCTQSLERMYAMAEQPGVLRYQVAEHFGELSRRLVDEVKDGVFMWLDPKLVQYGRAPFQGWEKAVDAFPLMKPDIFEASMCVLYERPTAAVFHLMRTMELGLDVLRRMVRVPQRKRPGWDGVIEAIDAQLQPKKGAKKSAATRKRHRFIADAVLLLRAVKEVRNTTMHDYTKSYTPSQAMDQYKAVQSFMQKMAEAV